MTYSPLAEDCLQAGWTFTKLIDSMSFVYVQPAWRQSSARGLYGISDARRSAAGASAAIAWACRVLPQHAESHQTAVAAREASPSVEPTSTAKCTAETTGLKTCWAAVLSAQGVWLHVHSGLAGLQHASPRLHAPGAHRRQAPPVHIP